MSLPSSCKKPIFSRIPDSQPLTQRLNSGVYERQKPALARLPGRRRLVFCHICFGCGEAIQMDHTTLIAGIKAGNYTTALNIPTLGLHTPSHQEVQQ